MFIRNTNIFLSDILFICSLHLKLVQLLKVHFDHILNIFIPFDSEILLLEIWFKEIKKRKQQGLGKGGTEHKAQPRVGAGMLPRKWWGRGHKPQAEKSQWGDSGRDGASPSSYLTLVSSVLTNSPATSVGLGSFETSSLLDGPSGISSLGGLQFSFHAKDFTEWGLMVGMTVQPCRLKKWHPGNHGGQWKFVWSLPFQLFILRTNAFGLCYLSVCEASFLKLLLTSGRHTPGFLSLSC